MKVYDQPVALGEKLYVRGKSNRTETVLEYELARDNWAELPRPPVSKFTIATLDGHLLVVGGEDNYTQQVTNKIFKFDSNSRTWSRFLSNMPGALTAVSVEGYSHYLIVIGGRIPFWINTTDVSILDTSKNKWISGKPLSCKDDYYFTKIVGHTVYVICPNSRTIQRAHLPTLVSGAKNNVWQSLSKTPYCFSSPVTINSTLFTVGGGSGSANGAPTTSIHRYDPANDQWIKIGNLPKPLCYPRCTVVNSELYVLGNYFNHSVRVAKLLVVH